jgi:stalled ribosome alternative rescue factor ArfA
MKTTVKLVLPNIVSRRNPMAALLRDGKYQPRVERSVKCYQRKSRNRKDSWDSYM